ncbi:MAG: hypothetical protein HYZ57_08940, partial [Acidobacteria bacterium]|nr:hypothetical protein [Acidobacteriota bacterium]
MNDSLSRRACLGALAGGVMSAQTRPGRRSRPNIVVIVSDDQGYGDLSCYDHKPEVKTPN